MKPHTAAERVDSLVTRLHFTGTQQQWLAAKRGSARHVFCEAEPRCCTTPSRDRHTCCQVSTTQPNGTHAAPPPPRTSRRDIHLANNCKPPSTLSGCTLQPLQLRSKQLHGVTLARIKPVCCLKGTVCFGFTSLPAPLRGCPLFAWDICRHAMFSWLTSRGTLWS